MKNLSLRLGTLTSSTRHGASAGMHRGTLWARCPPKTWANAMTTGHARFWHTAIVRAAALPRPQYGGSSDVPGRLWHPAAVTELAESGRHSGRSRHEYLREVFDVHALKGNGLQERVRMP